MGDVFAPLDSEEKNAMIHVATVISVLSVIQRVVVKTERNVIIDLGRAIVRQVGEALLVAFHAGVDKEVLDARSATVKMVQDVTL